MGIFVFLLVWGFFFNKGLPFSRLSKSHGYKTSVPEFFFLALVILAGP